MGTSERLTVDQLRVTPEFQKLTQKQRLFVATYVASGLLDGNYDAVVATRTAYQCKNLETARIMSYSLLGNIRIIEVLNMHFNRNATEEFMILLNRAVNNKHVSMAQIEALRLKANILGIGTSIRTKRSIGEVPANIVENDKKDRKDRNKKPKTESVKAPGDDYVL